MSKKENDREVSNLLSRLRESLKRPKKEAEEESLISEEPSTDAFDEDLSARLGKHLQLTDTENIEEDLSESGEESPFAVEELEIVADGTIDPAEQEQSEISEESAAQEADSPLEEEIFSDLDALMARMTPEQRAVFEAEMNAAEEEATEVPAAEESETVRPMIPLSSEVDPDALDEASDDTVEPLEEAEEVAESAEPTEEAVTEEEETEEKIIDGDVYTAVEEDEEYDLPEVEAFRALEARMTPEQRAQFEVALQEAQVAERAEKEARRLAARKEAEVEEQPVAEEIPAPMEEADMTLASDAVAEEPLFSEDTTSENEADLPQVICAPPISEDVEVPETSTFFAMEEDEELADMPTIKVGAEPSAFTLIDPPEPEVEEADEEAALTALLARMTPEQLARVREEMLSEEESASDADGETESAVEEEMMPEIPTVVEESEEMADTPNASVMVLREDPVEAILNDPEKLDELMARLTPEQAEELAQVLQADEPAPEIPISPIAEEIEEEPEYVSDWNDEDAETAADLEEPEMTVLWSEPVPSPSGTPSETLFEESTEMPREELPEDELYSMEISEDMTDEEISLMLGLGYEKELVYHLGIARIERVKKRAAQADAQDPEFTDAYAYEGQEYRHTEQNDRIRYCYGIERRRVLVRLIGTAFFALLLFLYECCGIFRGAFGGIFNPAHYPVIAIMAGWQLLVFAAAFSWKKLLRGVRSAFLLEPNNHAMTAIIVAVVMFNNILMAIVFKGSSLYLYNFPAALCLLCSVLCDWADIRREELTFEVVSSENPKYAAEAITLHTDMQSIPMDAENGNAMTTKNAMYIRRVGFVKHYFRRTNRKTRHMQVLNFVFLPLIAFAVVLGVITALIGNGTVASLNTFVVTVLLCMPVSYTVLHTLPLFYESRRLRQQNCAMVGASAAEEYNQYSTAVFEDKALFPPMLIKTKGLKLYENNLIYSAILKISLLFRAIGGPINEVLDLDKEELKRFIASGQAGDIAEGKVSLEHMSEEGVIATLSDGSQVVAGSAEFLQARGIYLRPSIKDQQLLDSGEMSILYLAFDGQLGARFYVDYQPDPEFEAMASMLTEDEFRVGIRTLDPGICDEMIAHKCQADASIHTVHAAVRELTDKAGSDAKVDSGLICDDDPRKMLLLLRAIRNLRRLQRFGLRLYGGAMILNMVVAIVLTAFSVAGYMPSILVSLYMLVWLATSFVLTALFLNK